MSRATVVLAALGAVLAVSGGPAQAYKVYISNEKGNSISVIDSETQAVVATAPVGRRPRGIAVEQ